MAKRSDFILVFIAIPLLLPVIFLAAGPVHGSHGETSPGVGNHLPSLEFTDLRGREHTLDWGPSAPKAAVIFFYELRCTECMREMIFMESIHRRAKDFGLEVFAVEGSGLDASGVKESLKKFKSIYGEPSFPVIPDSDYTQSALFGVQRLPSSFLVERHGVILSKKKSFTDWDAVDLTRKLERLLKMEEHFFSFALREIEIDKSTERDFVVSSRALSPAGRNERQALEGPLQAGDRVPGFPYTDIKGDRYQWEPGMERLDLTVVFFWGALCRSCIQEMAFLDEIFLVAHDRGLEIIAVEGSGLDAERTSLVLKRYQRFYPAPSYRVVPDPDYRIAHLFGVTSKLPQTFFIDGSGRVSYQSDEFIKGHEEGLMRKLEMALGLEFGALMNRSASARKASMLSPEKQEAPSVVSVIERGEEFRANLVEGDTYYEEWRFKKALPYYLRCLEINPRHVAVRVRVARIYQRQGKLETSLAHWLAILKIDPDHSEARSRVESLRGQGVQEDGSV